MRSRGLLRARLARSWSDLRPWIADNTARHMGILFAGHALRLALGLVSSAILARGLGPASLAVFAVIGAAMSIGATVADLGLGTAGVRFIAGSLASPASDEEQARQIARVCLWLKVGCALLTTGAILILAGPLARLLNIPAGSGPVLIRIAALGLFATSLGGGVSTVLQSLRRFPVLVLTQAIGIVVTVGLMAALFFGGRLDVASALAVGIVSALAAAAVGFISLPAAWRRALSARSARVSGSGRKLLALGKWLWVSAMLSILLSQLDLLLLNRLLAPSVVGFYALALNLAFKADIVNQTLHTVLLPVASGLDSTAALRRYARGSVVRSVFLALVVVALVPVARPFILAVYGPAYAPSVPVFYALLGVIVLDVLTMPLLLLAFPLDMPRAIVAADVVRVAAILALGLALIPSWGLYGAVAAKLAAKAAGALVLGGAIGLRLRRGRALFQAGASDVA